MVAVNFGHERPQDVLALRRVAEMNELSSERIGAGVTWVQLLDSPVKALAQAARTIGSPQIRSCGTLGGNVATASPAGDGWPVLAALDAQIEVSSLRAGKRLVVWRDFFIGVKRTTLAPDELVTAIQFPATRPRRTEFAKVGTRSAMVIAVINACVARAEDGSVRIALGSVGPTVIRASQAEEFASIEPLASDASRTEFMRLVRDAISPISDHRSTAEYRRHAAGVVALRLLDRVDGR
jgi:CO/xanthine dehydrogenase FAD-binding subunit